MINKISELAKKNIKISDFHLRGGSDIACRIMGDIVIEKNNTKTVIDSVSAQFLSGSTLDYESSLGGSILKVQNPNAVSSCGCGISFSA